MIELAKKEIYGFFSSLTGYIVIAVFLIITGLILWILPGENNLFENAYASLELFFLLAPWLFLFLVPALTMRLIAEEKRLGTIEYLLTQPITNLQFILGKYLAGLSLVFLALMPTLIYVLSVFFLGQPVGVMDLGATIGSYIGLFFLAAIYVAIGVFCSSLTDNQIIAFILAAIISFTFYLGFDALATLFGQGASSQIIAYMGINYHYISISKGLLNFSDLVYFLSVIFLFIYLTEIIFKSKHW
jgi:ABC-2 type transport system permease protein